METNNKLTDYTSEVKEKYSLWCESPLILDPVPVSQAGKLLGLSTLSLFICTMGRQPQEVVGEMECDHPRTAADISSGSK